MNISAPIPIPTENARKFPLPALYLPNGTKYASDGQLEDGSSSCERWGMGCGGLVVIAVIMEIVLAAVHPPYDSLWEIWGSSVADALVALGIVGDVLFGMWNNRIQTELRDRSNKKLGDAEKEAGDAREQAAKAQLETERLRAQFSWRALWEKRDQLQASLLAKPRGAVIIEFFQADPDSHSLARQFRSVFKMSDWRVTLRAALYGTDFWFGILVPDPENEYSAPSIVSIREAFASVGIEFGTDRAPPPQAWTDDQPLALGGSAARIFIGPKEPTFGSVIVTFFPSAPYFRPRDAA